MILLLLDKINIKINNLIFYLAYSFFFVSLFLGDIYQVDSKLGQISRLLRLSTYILSFLAFLLSEFKREALWKIIIILCISFIFLFFVKDAYLVSVFLLIYAGKDACVERIFELAFIILLFGTISVILLMLFGVLPDYMTALAFTFDLSRHSFGFYHSDVIPGILVFLQVFYIWIKKKNCKRYVLFIFLLLHIALFYFCRSRVCLVVGTSLSILLLVIKTFKLPRFLKSFLYYFSKYIALICSLISIVGMYLVTKISYVFKLDIMFSYRLTYAAAKMSRVGLKFINIIDNSTFYGSDNYVVDNGYLFLALRYGLLVLLGIVVINFLLLKRYSNDLFIESCVIFVFVLAFIDNDFLSYGFLPIIISSFNVHDNDYRMGHIYGKRISFCNNEHL